MTNTQLFDQPFRLTIRSSDGKPIDCIQSNSSYEISVSCFSRVTVSFESTHLNTNFTASHIVNNFRDSTNPSYQSTDSGTVDGLGASIHPVKFDKQPGLFCTRDKSCGHNVTYPTNLEFGQSSRCASLSEPAVTSCSSVFGRDSVIGESFNLQDKQSALRGNNQDSDSNLSLDFDYDSTSDSSSDIEEKSKNQRQSNKVESFKVDVQKNGSVDQFSLTTGRLIDDPLLLLQPKVHILKLPDFIVDSNESASKKDEIYSNLTEEIFKTDIDFVHRHVNGSTQNNDSDSDEDSFPFNLNAGFQPIKRNPFSLNFVSESGDEDNGNAESQRPKVNRKLRNYCFKRKRQISTDDSSEDSDSDTPSLELQIDDDDDDADLIGMEQVITKDDSKAEKNEEPSRNGLKMSLGSDDEITNGIIKRRRLDLFEGVVVETVEENRDYGENSVDKVANRRLSFNVDNSSEGYNSNDFSIGEIDEQELVPKYRKIESRKKTLPTNTDEVSKMALEEGFSTSSLKKAKTNRQKRTKISTSLKRNLFGDNEHQSAGSISPDTDEVSKMALEEGCSTLDEQCDDDVKSSVTENEEEQNLNEDDPDSQMEIQFDVGYDEDEFSMKSQSEKNEDFRHDEIMTSNSTGEMAYGGGYSEFKIFDNWIHPIYISHTRKQVNINQIKSTISTNYYKKNGKRPFICKVEHDCRRSFINLASVTNHLFSHFFVTFCPKCMKSFKNYYNMNRHFKTCNEEAEKDDESTIHPMEMRIDRKRKTVDEEKLICEQSIFAISPSLFKDIQYYIIEKASCRPVTKNQLIKTYNENYIKESSGNYRCLAHENCTFQTTHNNSIRAHIFPIYFHVHCLECNSILIRLSSLSRHYESCKKKNVNVPVDQKNLTSDQLLPYGGTKDVRKKLVDIFVEILRDPTIFSSL